MLNFRHIEVFHAVYQTGSISSAARLLGVSQPSVSKVLRHAESRLGFQLFTLVRGRLIPTNEAHILSSEARDLKLRTDSLAQTARNLARRDKDSIRLIVNHTLGLEATPAAIAAFSRQEPGVSFDIKTLHAEEMTAALLERRGDIVVSFGSLPHPRLSNIELASGRVVLLFNRKDIPTPPDGFPRSSLSEMSLIRIGGSGPVREIISRHIPEPPDIRGAIVVESYFVAGALVRHRMGAAIMDEFTARGSLTEDLDYRPIDDLPPFDVFAVHRDDFTPSAPQRQFLKVLQTHLRATG